MMMKSKKPEGFFSTSRSDDLSEGEVSRAGKKSGEEVYPPESAIRPELV